MSSMYDYIDRDTRQESLAAEAEQSTHLVCRLCGESSIKSLCSECADQLASMRGAAR